jgi:hypothetical protein
MDKLRSMETFIAVVESGSFTGAAARLEMSAVMVGKYVALLEAQLGTRLLERNTRRQSLTDAGRVYFEEPDGCWSRCRLPKARLNGCAPRPPEPCASRRLRRLAAARSPR